MNKQDMSNSPQQRSSSSSRSLTSQRRSTRRIRFDAKAKMYLVPSISDLSTSEIERLWNTPSEEEASRDDVVCNVVEMRILLKRGYSSDEILNGLNDHFCEQRGEDSACFRGLEHMITSEESKKKKTRKLRVVRTVLDEQDRQHDTGEIDDGKLADAASFATAYSRKKALELASNDARYVVRHILPTLRRSSSSIDGSNKRRSSRSQRPTMQKYSRPQVDDVLESALSSSSVDSPEQEDSSRQVQQQEVPPFSKNLRKNLGNINLLGDSEEMKDDISSVLSSFATTRLSKVLGKPSSPSSLTHCRRAAKSA